MYFLCTFFFSKDEKKKDTKEEKSRLIFFQLQRVPFKLKRRNSHFVLKQSALLYA